MPEPSQTKVEILRTRIEDGSYAVDAAKVADAIVERLMEGRSIKEFPGH